MSSPTIHELKLALTECRSAVAAALTQFAAFGERCDDLTGPEVYALLSELAAVSRLASGLLEFIADRYSEDA